MIARSLLVVPDYPHARPETDALAVWVERRTRCTWRHHADLQLLVPPLPAWTLDIFRAVVHALADELPRDPATIATATIRLTARGRCDEYATLTVDTGAARATVALVVPGSQLSEPMLVNLEALQDRSPFAVGAVRVVDDNARATPDAN